MAELTPTDDIRETVRERYAALRTKIDYQDPDWFRPFREAFVRFEKKAELPTDPLLLEATLVDREICCLFEHRDGGDVIEMMSALNMASTNTSAEERAVGVQWVRDVWRCRLLRKCRISNGI